MLTMKQRKYDCLHVAGGDCQTWSPGSPRDRATIYVCSGQTLRLPWNFTLQDGQRANVVKWYHHNKLIAIFSEGKFFPWMNRIHHLTSGVLEIEHLTSSDSGTYIIEVEIHNEDGSFSSFRRSAVVKIGGIFCLFLYLFICMRVDNFRSVSSVFTVFLRFTVEVSLLSPTARCIHLPPPPPSLSLSLSLREICADDLSFTSNNLHRCLHYHYQRCIQINTNKAIRSAKISFLLSRRDTKSLICKKKKRSGKQLMIFSSLKVTCTDALCKGDTWCNE